MIMFAALLLLATAPGTAIPDAWTGTYGLSALALSKKCPAGNTVVVTPGMITVAGLTYSVAAVKAAGNTLTVNTTDDDGYDVVVTLVRKGPAEIEMTTKSEDGTTGPMSYTPCTQ